MRTSLGLAGLVLFFCSTAEARSSECTLSYNQAYSQYHRLTNAGFHDLAAARELRERLVLIADTYPDCNRADNALYLAAMIGLQIHEATGSAADLDRALKDLNALAARYPGSPFAGNAHFHRGELHLQRGEPDQARTAFRETLNHRRCNLRGRAYERLLELEKQEDLNPNPPPAPPTSNRGSEKPRPPTEAPSNPETGESKPSGPGPASEGGIGRLDLERDRTAIVEEPLEDSGQGSPLPAGVSAPLPLPVAEAPVEAARVLGLRYWSNQDYTRVVVDFDREVKFRPPHLLRPDPMLGTPPRLFIDFEGSVISLEMKDQVPLEAGCYTMPIGDGLLKKARAGQYQPYVVRVVLDIERIHHFNAFALPGSPFRYVIDVYGDQKDRQKTRPAPPKPVAAAPGPGIPGKPGEILVVLDPGHGGKDPGAVGPMGTYEKDITLAIARRTKQALETMRPEVRVALTRETDKYLSLVERTAMANTLNADLFVSIHCNAATNPNARGVETYYLDNTTDRAALRLAAKENFVAEEVMETKDTTNRILADLITASKVEDSVPLARSLQNSLISHLRKKYPDTADHGVKKAPFWVLTGATMPCALVEINFISNREEEKLLRQNAYQQEVAIALALGISDYLRTYHQVVMAR